MMTTGSYLPARAMALVLGVIVAPSVTRAGWHHYEDSRLITNDFNDGDSFHVRAGRRHYIFRLYFVDAPETDLSFPERVDAQAAYWNLTPKQTLQLGRRAAAFTRRFLAEPFTVHTQRIDARGRSEQPRYFAMIETREGFLSEALVRNGLARVHGMSTELPDGTPSSRHWSRLRRAEKTARKAHVGGWTQEPPEPEPPPSVTAQDYVLRDRLPVFDTRRQARLIGILKQGARIHILGMENRTLLRIRFKTGNRTREGVCRLDDIDLPALNMESVS